MSLLKDYVLLTRLHRPIGIWLLLFPAYAGLFACHQPFPSGWALVFLIGAIVTRSAGCIYNDMVDRKFDQNVERTKSRPLARKESPLSLSWALFFLIFNLLVALGCLLFLPIAAGVVSIIFGSILIFTYPWLKRWTYWPQLFLGFTMNFGMIVAAVSVTGEVPLTICFLYIGSVFWTLGYDTIYGFQDIRDDLSIGVKSSAIIAQKSPRVFLSVCYTVAALGWLLGGVHFIFLGMCLLGVLWQVLTLDPESSYNCAARFVSNQWIGMLLWFGVMFR